MMYEGQDVEINNRITRILLEVLPADAEKITAKGVVGEDWAEVGFEFIDGTGKADTFDFDNTPDRAAADISEALIELRKLMAQTDAEEWNRAAFTATREGKFRVEFSYEEDEEDLDF